MLLDKIKKKAQDFYNKNIAIKQKTKTTGKTYLVKDDECLSSIEDRTKELTTVYGDYKNRNTNTCPHCGHVFEEPPTRGKKCPECGNQFYVRSNNRLFASDLLKPQDAVAADCFSHMLNMPDFNITVDFVRNILESRRKSFPVEPASRDVI